MKQKVGDGYHGRYRKEMAGGGGKNRHSAYEGIFSKLNYNAKKGSRNIPKFSFFEPDKDTCRTGTCKLCRTRVKILYTKDGNRPFMLNIEDGEYHKKWIGSGGWHCVISKSKPIEESETLKRLSGKRKIHKIIESEENAFYVEPENG